MPGTNLPPNPPSINGVVLDQERLSRIRASLQAIVTSRPARQQFLEDIMAVCGARGGIFWQMVGSEKGIDSTVPHADIVLGLNELGLLGDRQLAQTCQKMTLQTVALAKPVLLHPSNHPALPVQFSLMVIPLFKGRQPLAAIQLFIDAIQASANEAELQSIVSRIIQPQPNGTQASPRQLPGASNPASPQSKVNGNGTPTLHASQQIPPAAPVTPVAPASGNGNTEVFKERTNGNGSTPHSAEGLPQVPPPASTASPSATAEPSAAPTMKVEAAPTEPSSSEPAWSEFLLELHRTLRLDHALLTTVNDGRRILNCDRIALAIRRGGRLEIAGVSSVDQVNRRSDEMRAMLKLAREAIKCREPLSFSGDADRVPPQLEQPLADYLHLSHARNIRLVPLERIETTIRAANDEHAAPTKKRHYRPLGCLIIESFSDSESTPQDAILVEEFARHVSAAVGNALTIKKVPAVGIWRAIGGMKEWLHGRRLMKVLAVTSLVIAIVAGLTFIPFDYRLTAEGRLIPTQRQRVFAPWDGDVVELMVESGQHVAAGAPILRLENEELRQQLVAATNDLTEQRQRDLALQAEIATVRREGNDEQETRLRGQLAETQERIAGLTKRVQILQSRYDRLLVRAPSDGIVVTFQLDQLLKHRPVSRGDELLEIMQDDGAWELELRIPDHRLGHLLEHFKATESTQTPVEFILQTNTEQTFSGILNREDLSTRSIVDREGQAVIEARVAVADDLLPKRRIGAEVTAKVNCGKMNLGYVLFGDVLEFLQRHLWL